MTPALTIDEVIQHLDVIIADSKSQQSPMGYFAALYRKVTIKVKEGIAEDFFDNGPRMEKLDVIFANRYLTAYENYRSDQNVTKCWKEAFALAGKYWPIVLQHLLIGMNAHINLDLGIAAAEVSKGEDIDDLENDFNKINEILSGLVHGVEQDLSQIWPTLKYILKISGKVDDWLVGFSMKLARNGAWKFAKKLSEHEVSQWSDAITKRDTSVSKKANIVIKQGPLVSILLRIIRLGESGSIVSRIAALEH